MEKFEVGKTYRSFGGKERINCIFSGSKVAVLATNSLEYTVPQEYVAFHTEVKPKRVLEGWVNVYSDGEIIFYHNEEEAKKFCNDFCIACIHIRQEYEEGDGL